MIRKIVLTGGPCAGKTTAMQSIVEEFEEKGFNVYVVPEAATLLINMGIKPFGRNALSNIDFQKKIFDISLKLEKMAMETARNSEKDSIILYDRGLIDSKAYLNEKDWKKIINYYNFKDSSLFNKYDLVIHLRTVAYDKEELYTLSNNTARTETATEAKLLDMNTLHSWIGHPNLKILGNDVSFEEKINNAINEIYHVTGKPFPIQRQIKYLVSDVNIEEMFKNTNGTALHIEQYITKNDNDDELIFRKTIKDKDESYKIIIKKDTELNDERITTQRPISKKEYYDNYPVDMAPLSKLRYCFEYKNNYFKLDTFDDGYKILEIEETNRSKKIDIPPFITVDRDISDNKEYRNSHIYKLKNKIDQ